MPVHVKPNQHRQYESGARPMTIDGITLDWLFLGDRSRSFIILVLRTANRNQAIRIYHIPLSVIFIDHC